MSARPVPYADRGRTAALGEPAGEVSPGVLGRRSPGRRGSVHTRLWRRVSAVLVGVVGAAAVSVVLAGPASAHPLGNFTVNQYSGLRVQPTGVLVDYVLDMAEIPAFQTRSEVDANGDGTLAPSERDSWKAGGCARAAGAAHLTAGGRSVPLAVTGSALSFPPGAAGLDTLRLSCVLRAAITLNHAEHVSYRVTGYLDRVGWREITAVGDGTTLTTSTVPAASRSDRLTAYPADLLRSPLDVRGADLDVRPGGTAASTVVPATGPAAPLARGVDRATSAFTSLVARRHLTVAFGLIALLLSILLGALHALAPGHGKTVMAAFLVGGRGTLRQALTIGLTVTITHTAGVLVLGTVLTTSVALAPQTLYPWLGVTSGLILAGVGIGLLRRARAGTPLTHSHGHSPSDHHHHSHGHGHSHGHSHSHERHHADGDAPYAAPDSTVQTLDPPASYEGSGPHPVDQADLLAASFANTDAPYAGGGSGPQAPHPDSHQPRNGGRGAPAAVAGRGAPASASHERGAGALRGLLAMGFAGGLVPSPSALVVLLGAIALGRTWFGILLVIGYGAGMATALMGIGLLLARGRRLLERRPLPPRLGALAARLPLATASLVVLVGAGLAAQAALALTGR
jgi:nickel/cobalt exporter